MKSIFPAAVASLLLAAPALADTPPRAPASGGAAPARPAPLDPRWEVTSLTVSGLTVWTLRPGHFVRNAPPAGPSFGPAPR